MIFIIIGKTSTWLSNKYGVNSTNIRYMLKLIDHYGINILDRSYSAYTIEFKEEAIKKYIYYYNNERLKSSIKNHTPIQYRNMVLNQIA